MRTDDQLNR